MAEGTEPCQPCRTARARAMRLYRKRRKLLGGQHLMTDATGTKRRIQALSALGWSTVVLGQRLGKLEVNIRELTNRTSKVRLRTAREISELYDELSMTRPPLTHGVKIVLAHARKNNYAPPLAWDDDMIDDPDAWPTGLNLGKTRAWIKQHGTPEMMDRWEAERAQDQVSA